MFICLSLLSVCLSVSLCCQSVCLTDKSIYHKFMRFCKCLFLEMSSNVFKCNNNMLGVGPRGVCVMLATSWGNCGKLWQLWGIVAFMPHSACHVSATCKYNKWCLQQFLTFGRLQSALTLTLTLASHCIIASTHKNTHTHMQNRHTLRHNITHTFWRSMTSLSNVKQTHNRQRCQRALEREYTSPSLSLTLSPLSLSLSLWFSLPFTFQLHPFSPPLSLSYKLV